MNSLTANQIRRKFLDFYQRQKHAVLSPSSLVPENDPSVLFTTAGMQQFKRYYSNPGEAPALRVVTIQPSLRTTDIEKIGDDTHLTFFEMLGNFSFGYDPGVDYSQDSLSQHVPYFKAEAINLALEFLTKELLIDLNRIKTTYFAGDKLTPADQESKKILSGIRELSARIQGRDRGENFWGPTGSEGPCGPTVEIYVDNIEVWNLVFNQYYLLDGEYSDLSYQGVDTGMGLERIAAVIQGKKTVFAADGFTPLLQKIEAGSQKSDQCSIRIVADHIRAVVFLLSDGVMPTNKDQGYVLRRLIRRAAVHGQKLGLPDNILASLAEEVVDELYSSYPKLKTQKTTIIENLNAEVSRFQKTLNRGLNELNRLVKDGRVSGETAFYLYDSLGFPLELTEELIIQQGLPPIDRKEFEKALEKQKDRSRTAAVGMFKGGLQSGGEVETQYHTATHLLLAALRNILGDEVFQKGSNITAERLRFDFWQPEKMTPERIKQVEDLVNQKIEEDIPVEMKEMSVDQAKASGAIGVFDSKYGDKVRVYSIGSFSKEICGGPHVKSTGDLGTFKIIKEESSSAGVRRIKAILE